MMRILGVLVLAQAPSPEALVKDLESRKAEVRMQACETAKQAAVRDPRVLRALLTTKESDPTTNALEHRAVEALRAAGAPAVPILIEALSDKRLRHRACSALGCIRPVESRTVTALVKVMNEAQADAGGSSSAACALGALGEDGKDAIPALMALADDANLRKGFLGGGMPLTYANSITSLGMIGPRAYPALPLLIRLTETAQGINAPTVRGTAVDALGRIGSGPVLTEPTAGKAAAPPPDVLAALRKRLKDESRDVVGRAEAALAMLDPDFDAPVKARMIGLSHQDPRIRAQTCRVLGAMGAKAAEAGATLQRVATKDADESVRSAAEAALRSVSGGK